MKNTKQKGFTIVELVIVIAVIAILAAVLIPTFSNIIKKANLSNDIQTAKNISTEISLYKADIGIDEITKEVELKNAIINYHGEEYWNKLTPKTNNLGYHYFFDYTKQTMVLSKINEEPVGDNKIDNKAVIFVNGLNNIFNTIFNTIFPKVSAEEINNNIITTYEGDNLLINNTLRCLIKDGYYLCDQTGDSINQACTLLDSLNESETCISDFNKAWDIINSLDIDTYKNKTNIINTMKQVVFITEKYAFVHPDYVNQTNLTFEFANNLQHFRASKLVIYQENELKEVLNVNNINTNIDITLPSTIKSIDTNAIQFDENSNIDNQVKIIYKGTEDIKEVIKAGTTNVLIVDNNDNTNYKVTGNNLLNNTTNTQEELELNVSETSVLIEFKNYDDTLLYSVYCLKGDMPKYKGETPSKPQTDYYIYEFKEWEIETATIDKTYIAEFNELNRKYNLILNLDGGTLDPEVNTYECNIETILPIPTKENHTFIGWYTESELINKVETISSTQINDLEFFAKWKNNAQLVFKNTDKYMYRIGNKNKVLVTSLFVGEIDKIESSIITGFENINNSLDYNTIDGTLKFNGVGIIKLTVNDSLELLLEVIDAVNVTSFDYLSVSDNNVVLLKDITTYSTIEISNDKTLYGNGFIINFKGNEGIPGTTVTHLSYGYVTMYSGTLENVQIICPLFSKSYGVVEGDVGTKDGNGYYPCMRSAVVIENGIIKDSYIYGGRNNIYTRWGNPTIINTVLEKGATSNIQLWSGDSYTITLEDVTTIQYLDNNGVYGFGILSGKNTSSTNTNIIINGYLKQNNWLNSNDISKISNTYIKAGANKAFGLTKYVHKYNNNNYVCPNVIALNDLSLNITDNRNNSSVFSSSTIDISGYTGQVYSQENKNGEENPVVLVDSTFEYIPFTNGNTQPKMVFNIENPTTDFKIQDGEVIFNIYKGETQTYLDLNEYFYSSKYNNLNYEIICKYGSNLQDITVNNGKVDFVNPGYYYITYKVTDNEIYDQSGNKTNNTIIYEKTIEFKVSTINAKVNNAEFKFDQSKQYFYYKNVGWSDNKQFIPILNGLSIYDYDDNNQKYKVYDFDNENKNALNVIVRIEHENDNQKSTTKFYLKNGSTLEINYDTYADSHGSTYTTTIKTDLNGVIYAVNDGVTSATDSTSWEVHYYKYTGNNGKTVTYNVKSSVSSLIENTNVKVENVVDTTNGKRTTHYINENWGRDSITIFSENGYPQDVLFTGAGSIKLTKVATSTEASGFYAYRYGKVVTSNGVDFKDIKTDSNKITFDVNASDAIIDKTYTVVKSGEETVITGSISRDGFTFGGWYTSKTTNDTIGNIVIDGNTYTYTITTTADIKLYAHWLKPVTITFDTQGGSEVSSIETQSSLINVINEIPTKDNHVFIGWYDGIGLDAVFIGSNEFEYFTPEHDITLYAHWVQTEDIKTYSVTFNYNDGVTTNSTETYTTGGDAIVLPSPTYGGTGGAKAATFDGWYIDNTKIETTTYIPDSDITLVAKWKPVEYKFTYNGHSGVHLSINRTKSVFGKTGYILGSGTDDSKLSTTTSTTLTIYYGDTLSIYYKGGFKSGENTLKISAKTKGSTDIYSGTSTKTETINVTGNINRYAKTESGTSGGGGWCLLEGTEIMLADGSTKKVENLQKGDALKVFNHLTGKIDSSIIAWNIHEGAQAMYAHVFTLYFENGQTLSIAEEHCIFDITENQYRLVTIDNLDSFINHECLYLSNNITQKVKIIKYTIEYKLCNIYSPVSYYHMNCFANGFLTITNKSADNMYKFDVETLKYNTEDMNEKIQKYGQYTYEEFSDIMTKEVFDSLNVANWKAYAIINNISFEEIRNNFIIYLQPEYRLF